MPEPHPDTDPAGQSRPTEPPAAPGGTAAFIPAQRGAAAPDQPTDTTPDDTSGQPTDTNPDQPTDTGPDGVAVTAPVEPARPVEPATDVVPPRWTGSAAVPPPASGRRRRWLGPGEDDNPVGTPGHRPPPNPTLELPPEEREALESRAPVDPWADADPGGEHNEPWTEQLEHWQSSVAPYPSLPPTRSYPVSPPPAQQHHAPLPPTRSRPVPPAPRNHPPQGQPALQGQSAPQGQSALPVAPSPGPPHRSAPLTPPAPPGWRAPPGYVPVAVRRRRRWPGFMTLLTLLAVVCCCGCPAYFGKPMWEQYPASATLPAQVADLNLRDDSASKRAADRLEQDMRAAHVLAEGTFAGVYTDADNKRVAIVGVTGFRFSPDKDIDAEITRLTEVYQLTDPRSVDTGIRGEYQRCGTGRVDGTAVVVCIWVDHGSLGTALFDRRSVSDSAQLLADLRENIVHRG